MNANRFILKSMAMRAIGAVFPPYFIQNIQTINSPPTFQDGYNAPINEAEYNLDTKTDEELIEIIHAHASGVPMVLPLSIGYTEDDMYLFPIEPLISLTGKNIITRRYVSKGGNNRNLRGSVKERWSQDDYIIKIEGVFLGDSDTKYPYDEVSILREFCEAKQALCVKNSLLEIFNVNTIAIEPYDFPFTISQNGQAFNITAYSDDKFNLLVDV